MAFSSKQVGREWNACYKWMRALSEHWHCLLTLTVKLKVQQTLHVTKAVTVTVSVTCLFWSLAHAEQLLFSCVSSIVSICNYVTPCQHMFHKMWCTNLGCRLRGSDIWYFSMEGYHIKNCVIAAFKFCYIVVWYPSIKIGT